MSDIQRLLKKSEPIFAVADVQATVNYFREVLGFTGGWLWGDPPDFGGANCGTIGVMFCQQPKLAGKVDGHMHWFHCEDVAGLHDRHKAAGADIVSPLENKPWGFREYTVRDINGYYLRFAGPATYTRPATARDTLPANVRIDQRLPTVEEFLKVARSVEWNATPEAAAIALQNSLFGVVAIQTTTEGEQVIGSIRVIGDRIRFFYLQDVMVMPAHQHQRVGSAMMETIVQWLHQNAPRGAWIGLSTGKTKFYEQFGFRVLEGGMILGV